MRDTKNAGLLEAYERKLRLRLHLKGGCRGQNRVKRIFIFPVNRNGCGWPNLNPIDSTAILYDGPCDIQNTQQESTPGA